jgi:hypothetical protein
VTPQPMSSQPYLRAALAAFIVVGSLFTWIGIPLIWVWIAAQLSHDNLMVYIVALAACPATMAGWGWLLYRVNAVYVRLGPPDAAPPGAGRSAWLKSVSGERGRRAPWSLIDVTLAISVVLAIALLFVWFLFISESPPRQVI